MRKSIFRYSSYRLFFCKALTICIIIFFNPGHLFSQGTLLFHETFEVPGFGDSVVSSQTVPGVDDWNFTFTHSTSGLSSDSCGVRTGHITSLTTLPFSTIFNGSYKILSFSHICKIDSQDTARVWISTDAGITWSLLNYSSYQGGSLYSSYNYGNRFSSSCYGSLWHPNDATAYPDSSWWRTEYFDITYLADYQQDVRIKFTLEDGGTPGSGGNFGWLIDDIKVTSMPSYSKDVGIVGLINPHVLQCGDTMIAATITLRNYGSQLLTNPTLHLSVGNQTPTTCVTTFNVPPGQHINYTIDPFFHLPDIYSDTTIQLHIWATLAGDQNHLNDDRWFTVLVNHTPPAPQLAAKTIPTGNLAVLTVYSLDTVKWYDAYSGGNLIGTGNTLITPLLNTTTIYYPQAVSSSGCTGKRARDTVIVSDKMATISGIISYQNTVATPMNNATVKLFQGPLLVSQTTTNNQGYYEFTHLDGGNYQIIASSVKPWGGGNALDGLQILKHFTGLSLLNGLFLEAADVTADGAMNAADALLILQRFTGSINQFPSGNWLFETPNVFVPVNGNVIQNLKALCFGDVNGSYTPPF